MSHVTLDRAPAHVAAVLQELLQVARAARRSTLLEHESLALTAALGFTVPRHAFLSDTKAVEQLELAELGGPRLVVKAIAADLSHKTELGAIAVTRATLAELHATLQAMEARLEGVVELQGFLVLEYVEHDVEAGGELLLGLRHSREFGPLVTLGLGGVTAEVLGKALAPEHGPLFFSPALLRTVGTVDQQLAWIEGQLAGSLLGTLATGESRGRTPRASREAIARAVLGLCTFADWAVPKWLTELEINPLVFVEDQPVVLDSLARVPLEQPSPLRAPRPLDQAAVMLRPRSIAVMGASSKGLNPGRILLCNTLAAGFDRKKVFVVRPGSATGDTLEGATCVPDLVALVAANGGPVDLLALAIPAASVPAVIQQLCTQEPGRAAARGVVLIPGGLGERAGTESVALDLEATLDRARKSGFAPVVNGGNCLGLRSWPGKFDTLFIPHTKLPLPDPECTSPVALLSQSGAFAIARLSNLGGTPRPSSPEAPVPAPPRTLGLAPRYVITMGNQLDLTMSDWLAVTARDPAVRVFACYVEGFTPGDGLVFASLVQALAEEGRRVILYRAGRSPEGASASASHTASLAGDPVATRTLIETAGGLFADTIEEFEDLLALGAALAGRPAGGRRLGVLSNAGFECVAIADNLVARSARLELATLTAPTTQQLTALLEEQHLAGFVDVHHPLDVTPIATDAAFVRATELLLADPDVDLGLIGCVPLTAALATLPDQVSGTPSGITAGLVELFARTTKPWAVVVDSGALYDPFAEALSVAGLPVFRAADRATRALVRWAGGLGGH